MATRPVKVTLIGPDRVCQRFDHEHSRSVYLEVEDFLADVIAIQRRVISELVAAGCRYVQIDEPGYTAYLNPASVQQMRDRGEDPVANLERSIQADNAIIAGFPGVTFGIHICRGNRPSGERREGGYHSIAERLFSTLNHNRLLLEYDDPQRTGGFERLRFIPRAKVVALGLVSTKVATIESMGELKRRIEGLPPAPPARPQPSVWVRGRHGQQDHERRGPVAQARPRGRNRCTDLGAGGLPPRRKILTRRAPFLRLLGAPVVQWPHGT